MFLIFAIKSTCSHDRYTVVIVWGCYFANSATYYLLHNHLLFCHWGGGGVVDVLAVPRGVLFDSYRYALCPAIKMSLMGWQKAVK